MSTSSARAGTLLGRDGETFIILHVLPDHAGGDKRTLWLDRLEWKDGAPVVCGPTCTPQPVP